MPSYISLQVDATKSVGGHNDSIHKKAPFKPLNHGALILYRLRVRKRGIFLRPLPPRRSISIAAQSWVVLAHHQSPAQGRAVCEARPTGGDVPDDRRERLFWQGEKRRNVPKNEPSPVKNSAIPAGRRRCRKDCLFFCYFFLGKQKKVKMPGLSTNCAYWGLLPGK